MDDVVECIARYVSDVRETAVAADTRSAALQHIVDTFGCAIAAVDEEPCRIVSSFAREFEVEGSGARAASMIGAASLCRVEDAAFANASMARCLDFNDVYSSLTGGHPSDAVFGVFAVAEARGATGHSVLVGVNVAYEVFAWLADGVPLRRAGWDQSVLVAIASAAGICAALELSRETTAMAISLAATACNGLRVTRSGELSAWKGCATPYAVREACVLTRLAELGLTGPERPFLGPDGFVEQIGGDLLTRLIGAPQGGQDAIRRTALKLLPVESCAQAPLEIFLRLQLRPEEVAGIRVSAYDFLCDEIGGGRGDAASKWDPRTRETADHSLPYLLAVALTDGRVNLGSFDHSRICDPELRPLMNRIQVVRDPTSTSSGSEWQSVSITIDLTNGRTIEETCRYFTGHPRQPASDEQIDAKFMELVGNRFAKSQATGLLSMLRNLDRIDDLSEISAALRAVPSDVAT